MTSLGAPGLQQLPYELVAYVVEGLEVEDVFNWSLCCKHFQYIIREDRFCKPVIMTKAPGSVEAQEALETGRFSRALRRLAKRRSALSRASPYVVANIACADSYGLFGGKLCYILENRPQRWLRILDIHACTDWELVVDIPMLVRAAVPQAANSRKFKFRVLYQAAGIVSCLLSFALARTENWIIVINPGKSQLLLRERLDSTARIFVRNNDSFLYVGTHSGEGADGLRKWVIRGFDLNKGGWLPHPRIHLPNLAGHDMGSTVCFEIFGDYFYGLSNQSLFEADDPDWTSHYYCFRFPLNDPSMEKLHVMNKEDSWRRKHSEGPIDDRWGFLSLEVDEATKDIVILECRKEWLRDRSGSRRTYYTTRVVFCRQTDQETDHQAEQQPVEVGTLIRRGVNDRVQAETYNRRRDPCSYHPGDDSVVSSLLVRSKTFFCAYIRCCHTFIDLIDDTSMDAPGLQRIRIRTGHRKLKPEKEEKSKQSMSHAPRIINEAPRKPDSEPCQQNAIFMWPPDQHVLGPNSYLDKVQQLLNVKDHQGCVTATGDGRSVIYATSDGPKGLKILVFLSFDPASRFGEMEYGGKIIGQQVSRHLQEGDRVDSGKSLESEPNIPLTDGIGSIASTGHSPTSLPATPNETEADSWVCYQRAMHFDLQKKLYFSR
ncbi:putative F-box domain-containing protein [Rosellinia necatrix]|uniref:Putative F-box domain-containing protein n=1 Tax=Rosellinia necatrix TaxID=77044 RepID=A0A1S7ULJ1_ROSNE|nr:putative F-box domain-containing protein [Rosellinia necatrix]